MKTISLRRAQITTAVAVAIIATGGLAGCSDSSPSATPTPVSSPTPSTSSSGKDGSQTAPTLAISGFAFSDLTVKPGEEVTVTNADSAEHTVNVNGTDIDVTVPGGGEAQFTAPKDVGDYPLTCDFHAAMHGTLTVSK